MVMEGCSEECVCAAEVPSKSLFGSVDISRVVGTNEAPKGSCKEVLVESSARRGVAACSRTRVPGGLVVKIPFVEKVALVKIEIRCTFRRVEICANDPYVSLESQMKNQVEYALPGTAHIVPVSLPPYKYKSVDHLTVRLKDAEGEESLSYLVVCGAVKGALPRAVNVSYELYPVPEDTKQLSKEFQHIRME